MKSEMLAHVKVGRLIRLFGWITIICGILLLVALIVPAMSTGQATEQQIYSLLLPVIICGGMGWLQLYIGSGVKQHKKWARVVGIVYGALALFNVPIGTIAGIYILSLLIRKWDENSDAAEAENAQRVLQVTAQEATRKREIKARLLPSERMCEACGRKYSPSDYNVTASEWLCSTCKHPLPKD